MLRRPASLICWPRQQLGTRLATRPSVPIAARYSSSQASRIDRFTSKLPRRLQKYTNGLRNAPASHVVSFLLLHEITAVVSLLALFGLFHYTTFMPTSYMMEHFEEYLQSGIARFDKYFRHKGWFGFGQQEPDAGLESGMGHQGDLDTQRAMDRFKSGERKYEILMEVALAYAVAKALLPIRIIASFWATPWFAGVLWRAKRLLTRGQ